MKYLKLAALYIVLFVIVFGLTWYGIQAISLMWPALIFF